MNTFTNSQLKWSQGIFRIKFISWIRDRHLNLWFWEFWGEMVIVVITDVQKCSVFLWNQGTASTMTQWEWSSLCYCHSSGMHHSHTVTPSEPVFSPSLEAMSSLRSARAKGMDTCQIQPTLSPMILFSDVFSQELKWLLYCKALVLSSWNPSCPLTGIQGILNFQKAYIKLLAAVICIHSFYF